MYWGTGRDSRYSGTRRGIGASGGIGGSWGCRGLFGGCQGHQGVLGASRDSRYWGPERV